MKNRKKRFIVYLFSALMALSVISCTEQQEKELKIYHGGTILTVDSDFSEVEAIVFKDNKILATGDFEAMKKNYGKNSALVNLEGKTMLPGFIDPHAHVLSFAPVRFLTENIGVTNFATTEEALAHLKKVASERPKGEWILGSGWDPSIQDGVSELTFKELNAVSTDHPVFVLNTSGHLAYVNEKTYEVAGITQDVVNPPGAEYSRDENGKLNGVIKNNVAYLPVWLANPAAATLDMTEALISLLNEFNQYGVTTTSEFALGAATQSHTEADLLFAATERDDFSARVMAYPMYTISEQWDKAGTKMYDGNDLAKIVGFKFIADGSNQGYTGLQREPYFDPEHAGEHGIAYMSVDQLKEMTEYRAGQGWHMSLHGNGDAAIDNILDVMEYLKSKGYDLSKIRPRIEHCSILHDDQIERMKELDVSASFLIGHVHYWGTVMRDKVFGPEKAMLLDRAASVEKEGVSYTLQSDFSVTEPDMLRMIQTAVERKTFKEPDFVLNPDERVSVESAIRAVTIEAAWQMMSEDIIGSLEAGKYADFVILENDPRKVDESEISEIKVLETWMNGKQVYSAE
ncbi:amidohydrolase family protein [uncultured Draconibacterium sp.]|uniref:amidohydrolase n=1 Tax=uncultured Draconibacterium sp. TaxID=1573823 RepID=UPI003217D560